MSNRRWRLSVRIMALGTLIMLMLALCGCTMLTSIREDSVSDGLAPIDPEAGVAHELQVRLYYRLTGEAYLVGVNGTLTVQPGERAETAIIRELIAGVPPLSNNISEVVPEGTSIEDVALDGAILYVTLSNEFFDASAVTDAQRENGEYLANSFITQQEYDQRVAAAEAEMYLKRYLAVCSIVNSITEYAPNVRVQILFNIDGRGSGVRVNRAELGFKANEQAASDLIEPMEYIDEAVISPMTLVSCALDRMMAGEYEKAYALFAETESGGLQKPTYASFETELHNYGRLTAYSLYSYSLSEDMSQAEVKADLEYTMPEGGTVTITDTVISLKSEGSIYKLGFYALLELLKGGDGAQ